MMRQFFKVKIFIKEADERSWWKMVQEKVALFEPEEDNFVILITIENAGKEDSKITLRLPVEIKKVLRYPTNKLDYWIIVRWPNTRTY